MLDPVAAEAPLTFAWCTCFFFMVCGDGCILRTHRVLGKGVVYTFIFGVRMVSFFMSWYTLDMHLEL